MNKLSLKAIRVNKNLTQEEVAKELGISPATLSRWESGSRSPRLSELKKLLDFYGVPIDYVEI